jgi:AmiR/NasT family two-component response regulator
VTDQAGRDAELARLAEDLRVCEEEVEGLEAALASRHVIGMAQGMLMLRYELTQDQAFEFLRRNSNDENIKLRDVASRVVVQVGKERWHIDPKPPGDPSGV